MFSKTLGHGNSKNKIRQTDEVGKRVVSMERNGHERNPDGLSQPNQNTILINIMWYYFKIYEKFS